METTRMKGIDVSRHNGDIDWTKIKKTIDFAIIRAGYGAGNLDKKFIRNAVECERNAIPYGFYWFSYAYTPAMAKREADYCCDAIRSLNPTFPICFDFEYGSLDYAQQNGYNLKNDEIVNIAKAFLDRVEERGYYAMIYSNPDFLENKGLKVLVPRYDLWIAKWSQTEPAYDYGIWQYGTTKIDEAVFDANISVKNYPEIISRMNNFPMEDKWKVMNGMPKEWWSKYLMIAKRALLGIYNDLQLDEICLTENLDRVLLNKVMEIIYA